MNTELQLISKNNTLAFINEAILEDFIWSNLKLLLNLMPFKKQYEIQKQYCDILAIKENRQLVIIELKNIEDRYIIQQLTRYYAAIINNKPFANIVDYEKPIQIIAIQPSYHRDNFTDVQYHQLDFSLISFKIIQESSKAYFQLDNALDNICICRIPLAYSKEKSSIEISAPPRALINRLSYSNEKERETILIIREKLLTFDSRIKETIKTNSFFYGKGISKLCAELWFNKISSKFLIYFWLPCHNSRANSFIRMRIIFSESQKIETLCHTPQDKNHLSGTPVSWDMYKRGLKQFDKDKYYQIFRKLDNSLDSLTDFALKVWLERV
jgi:RecB family endonuclease NucS